MRACICRTLTRRMNGDIDAEVREGDRTVTNFINSLIFYPFLQMNYRCMNYNRVKRMKIHIKKESHYEKKTDTKHLKPGICFQILLFMT